LQVHGDQVEQPSVEIEGTTSALALVRQNTNAWKSGDSGSGDDGGSASSFHALSPDVGWSPVMLTLKAWFKVSFSFSI
jgi:hypothetical protein